jgi:hypothetical protein
LLREAAAVQAPADTSVVVLREQVSFRYDAEGRQTYHLRRVYQVRTQAGVEGWGQTQVQWEPWHEARPQMRVRVTRADGTAVELDPKTIAESPVSQNDDIYSDARQLRAPLPGLAPGAVVEEDLLCRDTEPSFAAGTVHRVYFGFRVPAERTELTIEAPKSLPLRYVTRLLPEVRFERAEARGRVTLKFTHGPMKAQDKTEENAPVDVPQSPWAAPITTGWSASSAAPCRRRSMASPAQPGWRRPSRRWP